MAQAFIPEQEVKEGIIEIFITEGKLDGKEPFELKKNNLRLKDNLPISLENDYCISNSENKIFERNLFTTAVYVPKSFHLTPFSHTFEIHQPTLIFHSSQ